MAGQTEATRQSDWISPPMVGTDGKFAGAALAVTSTASYVDLTTVPAVPAQWGGVASGTTGWLPPGTTYQPNALGGYIDLYADGGDVYILTGPSAASVSAANVPNPATTNTVTTGTLTTAVGACICIPAGTRLTFKPFWGPFMAPGAGGNSAPAGGSQGQNSPNRFLAFVTKAGVTATLRIYASSPQKQD